MSNRAGADAPITTAVAQPTANLDAVATFTGVANKQWVLVKVITSYSATPTTLPGVVTIESDTDDRGQWYVTEAGPAPIDFNDPQSYSTGGFPVDVGGDLVVTLDAGGVGILGRVTAVAKLLD